MKTETITKTLGQYFTPLFMAQFMVSLISKPKDAQILDPCAGTGVFPKALVEAGYKKIDANEIDFTLPNYSSIEIKYRNFLDIRPEEKYDIIISNPPYVRWKNIKKEWREKFRTNLYWSSVMNGLSDLIYAFIYHSVNMLKPSGELIFITPLFWTESVYGRRLREHLIKHGRLELLINFNEMRIFENVSSTIAIFKYVKEKTTDPIKTINIHSKEPLTPAHLTKVKEFLLRLKRGEEYIHEEVYEAFLHPQFNNGDPWRPIPKTALQNKLISYKYSSISNFESISLLAEIAQIGNGMVSGLDAAFQLDEKDISSLNSDEINHTIYVYKAHTLDRLYPIKKPVPYIYVNNVENERELTDKYPHFYQRLSLYKDKLAKRYSYGRYIPWWHWVFPRNKHLFENCYEKIFVPSKERYNTRGYFRFSYTEGLYYATQDVTVICPKPNFREGAKYLLALLNSTVYQEFIKHAGFTRGGVYDFSEKPLAEIPIVRVNWNDVKERKMYEGIISSIDQIIREKSWEKYFNELDAQVDEFIKSKLQI